jgi:hypothetical protein
MNFLKNKFKLWWLQAFFTFVSFGFFSLLYFYFVKSHLSFGLIFFADFCGYIAILIYLLFQRRIDFKKSIRLGFILIALAMLLLLLPFSPKIIIFPYTIFTSIGLIMFYCPYNVLYFKERNKGNLTHMTFYWAVGVFVGVIAPLVGGFLLGTLNYLPLLRWRLPFYFWRFIVPVL